MHFLYDGTIVRRGFSLIECTVYIAGVALVSSLVFRTLYQLHYSQQSLYTKVASRVALSNALAVMRRDIAMHSVSKKQAITWSVIDGYLIRKSNSFDHYNKQKIIASVILNNVRFCDVLYSGDTIERNHYFATITIERTSHDQLSTFALLRNKTVVL